MGTKRRKVIMRESSTPEYRAWGAMIQRCTNPKHPKYKAYGGRGITVCARWREYQHFLEDLGRRPGPAYSLDRERNEGNYEPGNCRWATIDIQQNNTRMNKYYTIEGVTNTLAGWAYSCGASPATVHNRINVRKWDLKRALTAPPILKHRNMRAKA